MISQMYQALRPSRSEYVAVRTQSYHVRVWGTARPDTPPLVMLHGWMDVSASWQFVIDALTQDRQVIAPDWRGFGLTKGAPVDTYWLADYLGDLDCLLDHYAADTPVDLVGHSMGGNIAMLFSGVRPARIRRLVNLEGFGMPASRPTQVAGRYAKWMDSVKALHRGDMALKAYSEVSGVARRLMKTNPRLPQDKADWLAAHWAQPMSQADGTTVWQILGDPAHKISSAQLYQVEETLELYRCITAPTLAVEASDDSLQKWWGKAYTLDDYHVRLQSVADCRVAVLQDAAHMLHHDQPLQLAHIIEDFLR